MPRDTNRILVVRLSDDEYYYAFKKGCDRWKANKDRPDSHGFKGNPKQIRIDGAISEMAVRKAGGFPLTLDLRDPDGPDIGDNGHVRSTKFTIDNGTAHCRIRPCDVENYPQGYFILATEDKNRNFLIFGGYQACLVKPEWLTDWGNGRPPAYGVPWFELDDIEDIFNKIIGIERHQTGENNATK